MYLALLAQRAIKLLRRHKSSGKRNTTIFYFVLFTKFSRSFTYLTFRFIVKNQKHSACSLFTMLFAAWRVLQMCERKPNWTSCHQNYSWSYIILCDAQQKTNANIWNKQYKSKRAFLCGGRWESGTKTQCCFTWQKRNYRKCIAINVYVCTVK